MTNNNLLLSCRFLMWWHWIDTYNNITSHHKHHVRLFCCTKMFAFCSAECFQLLHDGSFFACLWMAYQRSKIVFLTYWACQVTHLLQHYDFNSFHSTLHCCEICLPIACCAESKQRCEEITQQSSAASLSTRGLFQGALTLIDASKVLCDSGKPMITMQQNRRKQSNHMVVVVKEKQDLCDANIDKRIVDKIQLVLQVKERRPAKTRVTKLEQRCSWGLCIATRASPDRCYCKATLLKQ